MKMQYFLICIRLSANQWLITNPIEFFVLKHIIISKALEFLSPNITFGLCVGLQLCARHSKLSSSSQLECKLSILQIKSCNFDQFYSPAR